MSMYSGSSGGLFVKFSTQESFKKELEESKCFSGSKKEKTENLRSLFKEAKITIPPKVEWWEMLNWNEMKDTYKMLSKDIKEKLIAKGLAPTPNKVIRKPWGYEEILEENKYYRIKMIFVKPGCRTSYQYHKKKIETWIFSIDPTKVVQGFWFSYLHIEPFKSHRLEAPKDKPLIVVEIAHGSDEDIIRLEDDYGREKNIRDRRPRTSRVRRNDRSKLSDTN